MGLPLILGLGNPGPEYRDTRHNVGFRVVEELARRRGLDLGGPECSALVGEAPDVVLALPQTYMNRSGHAAACLVERRQVPLDRLLVVFDDVSLPLGALRLRAQGSPGGHRGMESIVESLRDDGIPRLRIGIREGEEPPAGEDLVDFVLSPFPPELEEDVVPGIVGRSADACEAWLEAGIDEAMNRFNKQTTNG